jgi:hypothetical protein
MEQDDELRLWSGAFCKQEARLWCVIRVCDGRGEGA